MQKTAIIIHGSHGHPQENWFPWLKTELERLGYKTYIPAFPTPEGQTYEAWLNVLKDISYAITEDSILIGHSTGCVFILNALNDLDIDVKAVFLVAPFMEKGGHEEIDELNKTFIEHTRDHFQTKSKAEYFLVYYSNNDPYLSTEISKRVTEFVDGENRFIKDAGHFNEAAGYTEFPELLSDIQKIS